MTALATASAEARWHYVTVRRGTRTGVLAGPFATNAEARRWVEPVRRAAADVDPFTEFDGFGTAVAPTRRPGRLNAALGIRITEPWS